MGSIICELCGSNDLIKDGDFFVCQNCGTKYTPESAKKLIGTVKIDNSENSSNLYELARRAVKSNDIERAHHYYEQLTVQHPDDWEAAFFSVLYGAGSCKIGEIGGEIQVLRGATNNIFTLVNKLSTPEEKTEAIDLIISNTKTIVSMLNRSAYNHYDEFRSLAGSLSTYVQVLTGITSLYIELAKNLENYYNDYKRALDVYNYAESLCESVHKTARFLSDVETIALDLKNKVIEAKKTNKIYSLQLQIQILKNTEKSAYEPDFSKYRSWIGNTKNPLPISKFFIVFFSMFFIFAVIVGIGLMVHVELWAGLLLLLFGGGEFAFFTIKSINAYKGCKNEIEKANIKVADKNSSDKKTDNEVKIEELEASLKEILNTAPNY